MTFLSEHPDFGNSSLTRSLQWVRRPVLGHDPSLVLDQGRHLLEATLGSSVATVPAGHAGTSWDVKAFGDDPGVLVQLHVRAESAVTWVMVQPPVPGRGPTRLHLETFAVYGHPHFVRGQRDDQWAVTAVQYVDGNAVSTLFPRGAYPALGNRARPMDRCAASVHDMKLVQAGRRFWLLRLMGTPALAQRGPSRILANGPRRPSELAATLLDEHLQSSGPACLLLGDTPVYEFDAGATAEGGLVVCATTPEGAVLAVGTPGPDGAMPPDRLRTQACEAPLTSPSVLVLGDTAHVAALAAAGTSAACVRYGALPVG